MFLALRQEHLYPVGVALETSSHPGTRRWGAGTAAIVRLLVAEEKPLTQVAIVEAVGVTQPRASQVLKQLGVAGALVITATGYRGKPARLLDLYSRRARPHLVEPESYLFSTRPLVDQAHRIVDAARGARVRVAFSADLAPDLVVPWRHPTAHGRLRGRCAQAEGHQDWSLPRAELTQASCGAGRVIRRSSRSARRGPRLPTACRSRIPSNSGGILDLGGTDRLEAAERSATGHH